jgi:L-malate glycosyltransferase
MAGHVNPGSLRVLHFATGAGHSDYFRALAEHSSSAGVNCTFGTLDSEGVLHHAIRAVGVSAFGMGVKGRSRYGAAIVALARYLRLEDIQVMHTHLYDACFVGLVAASLARVPVRVATAHHVVDSSLHLHLRGKRLAFTLDAVVLRRFCDCIVSPSAEATRVLRRDYAVPRARIAEIPYGFRPFTGTSPLVRERTRTALGLGPGPVFIAVGRLHWVKDLPTLIAGFSIARKRMSSARLVILGDGEERSKLECLSNELGVRDDVVFLGHRTDVPDLLAAADVFVHTSLGESFNQALLEALAAGLPVITTDAGIASDVVTDQAIGAIVRTGHAEALACAMHAAVRRPSSGQEKRRKIPARYPVDAMVRSYANLYSRWLSDRRNSRSDTDELETGE